MVQNRPQLLVSVVSSTEAREALLGGADIIDVKNPLEGSLGANFPHVIKEVRMVTPAQIPLSVAVGDVPNLPGTVSLAVFGAALCGASYIKIGMYGVRNYRDAVYLLSQARRAASDACPEAKIIAVGYGDAATIGALSPALLPRAAREAGIAGCMVDTFSKRVGRLLDWLDGELLKILLNKAKI